VFRADYTGTTLRDHLGLRPREPGERTALSPRAASAEVPVPAAGGQR
jgi:hypothetical protein